MSSSEERQKEDDNLGPLPLRTLTSNSGNSQSTYDTLFSDQTNRGEYNSLISKNGNINSLNESDNNNNSHMKNNPITTTHDNNNNKNKNTQSYSGKISNNNMNKAPNQVVQKASTGKSKKFCLEWSIGKSRLRIFSSAF